MPAQRIVVSLFEDPPPSYGEHAIRPPSITTFHMPELLRLKPPRPPLDDVAIELKPTLMRQRILGQ